MPTRNTGQNSGLYQKLPLGIFFPVPSYHNSVRGSGSYRLATRSIESGRPYVALSYKWRDEDTRYPIFGNGREYTAMETVYRFLYLHFGQLRVDDIFIDSICINQSDLQERASQVGLMGKIYSNAVRVCIWLDDHPTMLNRCDLRIGQYLSPLSKSLSSTRLAASIFSKPYWRRAWVIQELALANHFTLFWGPAHITEVNLQSILDHSEKWSSTEQIDAESVIRNSKYEFEPQPLEGLLKRYSYTTATDARDKVYAFLSLASDAGFPLDYSEQYATAQVFRDVLDFCQPDLDFSVLFAREVAQSLGLRKQNFSGAAFANDAHSQPFRGRGGMCLAGPPKAYDALLKDPPEGDQERLAETIEMLHVPVIQAGSRIVGTLEDEAFDLHHALMAGEDNEVPTAACPSPSPTAHPDTPMRLYTCTSLDDPKHDIAITLILSGNVLHPDDVICRFANMPFALAIRTSGEDSGCIYRGVGKVLLSDDNNNQPGDESSPTYGAEGDPQAFRMRGLREVVFEMGVGGLGDFVLD